eukprot:SAG31_NODE_1596_length_7800_cov_4.335801_6_plen_422_part_00
MSPAALVAQLSGEGCYFLVFVQLFEKYGTLIERNRALIEKVSPCRPDGTPMLIFCNGETAVPFNRSDPDLRQWVQNKTSVTERAFMPYQKRGKWDASATKEASGRYVLTYGSCQMLPGASLADTCSMNTSNPAILSYASKDLKSWHYLGQPWSRTSNLWPIPGFEKPMHVPRTECPYLWQDQHGHTFVKISAPGAGRDYIFVGQSVGNGSQFSASAQTAAGVMLDWGQIYASAVMSVPTRTTTLPTSTESYGRTLLWGWVLNQYNFSKIEEPPFDGALSLPRVMDVDSEGNPTWEIAHEIERLRTRAAHVARNVSIPAGGQVAIHLPAGATGDAIEIMLKVSGRAGSFSFGLSVRATADRSEETTLYYTSATGMELNGTSADPMASACTCWLCSCNAFRAPPLNEAAEEHTLRAFVDKVRH